MYAFMAGLPRSGSTLISAILNQNPDIHSGTNSPICGMMVNLERSILSSEQWAAHPKPDVMPRVITGLLDDWYSDVKAELVIDKCREWVMPEHFQVLLRCLNYEPKVIVPVRSVPEVLASFITLVHKNEGVPSFIDKEIEARQEFNFYRAVDDVRCDHLMRPKGLIDNILYGLKFATASEYAKHFCIVEYDNLLDRPAETMEYIYDFLELEPFAHDFDNIVSLLTENDDVYGLPGMHDVRTSISRRAIDPEKVLTEYSLNKYTGSETWR